MKVLDPDCRVGKHPACPGYTYDDDGVEVPCECPCHDDAGEFGRFHES